MPILFLIQNTVRVHAVVKISARRTTPILLSL